MDLGQQTDKKHMTTIFVLHVWNHACLCSIFQKEETEKLKDAQGRMEEAHQTKMEQLKETIKEQHEQDIAAVKTQMNNEMQEVQAFCFISPKNYHKLLITKRWWINNDKSAFNVSQLFGTKEEVVMIWIGSALLVLAIKLLDSVSVPSFCQTIL